MFVALYRWRVKPGREAEFRAAWVAVTEATYRTYGSLGSRLHRDADGAWVAYAQWPSRAAWEAAWTQGKPADPAATATMRDCVEADSVDVQRRPTMCLEVADDLLRAVTFRPEIA
jgi:quinol monooxygenase YgiN